MKHVLVSGSRDFPDEELVRQTMRTFLRRGDVLIHGGARGVDSWCGQEAKKLGVEVSVYLAEWDRYGKRAGVMRNRAMLDHHHFLEGFVTLIFWDGQSKGTKHMLDLCNQTAVCYILWTVTQ